MVINPNVKKLFEINNQNQNKIKRSRVSCFMYQEIESYLHKYNNIGTRGLVVQELDSQYRGSMFKTTGNLVVKSKMPP